MLILMPCKSFALAFCVNECSFALMTKSQGAAGLRIYHEMNCNIFVCVLVVTGLSGGETVIFAITADGGKTARS